MGSVDDIQCQECQDKDFKPNRRLELSLSEIVDGNMYQEVRQIRLEDLPHINQIVKEMHLSLYRVLQDVAASKSKDSMPA